MAADMPVKRRVLVVDDEPDNRALMEQILDSECYELKVAANGAEGVEAFSKWPAQLVFMDIRMPVMDGYEATRRIRGLPGGDSVRIVALTASVLDEDRGDIIQAGCDEMLVKPFRIAELFACIDRQFEIMAAQAGDQ
jgi:CheY-like chemotaxis protein